MRTPTSPRRAARSHAAILAVALCILMTASISHVLVERATAAPPTEDGLVDEPTSVRVLDDAGAPVRGALVYVEAADLTLPLDNVDAYLRLRQETGEVTDADGVARVRLPPDLTVAVRADGYLPVSIAVPADAKRVEVRLDPMTVRVTAHRGGAAYAPENTLVAVRKAGLLGVPAVEVDVQMTSDEVLVLVHDGFVEDPAGIERRVWMQTYEDLRRIDVGSSMHPSFSRERIPRLDVALALIADLGVFAVVEVKITDDPRHVLVQKRVGEAIRAAGLEQRAVVISFDPTFNVQCGVEGLRCGYIEAHPQGARTDPLGAGKDVLSPFIEEHHVPHELANPDYVAASQAAGNRVTVWTVDDPARVPALVRAGVDGITTDVPWAIMQTLRARAV